MVACVYLSILLCASSFQAVETSLLQSGLGLPVLHRPLHQESNWVMLADVGTN